MSKQVIKPTEAELEILNILWTHGPASVKDVHERLSQTKAVGYTTALKTMQIMLEKQLLTREGSARIHVYRANVSQDEARGQMVQRMIETAFNGSAMQLVMQALGNHKPSNAELQQIQEYLAGKMKK